MAGWFSGVGAARRGLKVYAVVSTVWLAGVAPCSTASAKVPTGDFAVFSQCPRFTVGVRLCVFSRVTHGEIRLAGMAVPIAKTITLQGGLTFDEETEVETFVGALDGESLSKTPLSVPGGLTGLVPQAGLPAILARPFQEAVSRGLAGVSATSELVGLPQVNTNNVVNEDGIGVSLPVRIKLDNPFLGKECYIGSHASPVTFNLTTGKTAPPGPNKPIDGSVGDLEFSDQGNIDEAIGARLLDNSFAAPVATGCGGSFSAVLDAAIDKKIGLPSAAGNNTVVENGLFEDTLAKKVIASEK